MQGLALRRRAPESGLWVCTSCIVEPALSCSSRQTAGRCPWWADRSGLDPGGECLCVELHSDAAAGIPRSFISRLLDQDEVAELERIMVEPKEARTVCSPARLA
jgi:hypothetical protein